MIIDTHCHLDDTRYDEDLQIVLQNATCKGVQGVLIPGADITDLPKAQAIAHKNEGIFYAAGVHPYHIDGFDEAILRVHLADAKCIAVGECGLDYFRLPQDVDEKEKEKVKQQEIFALHVRLARELQKPLIVHIREANEDSKRVLIQENAREVGGVLHCYNASEHLLELAEHGFYFGIGGVLTFKNAKKLLEILPKIPLERLVIETDAPYLTPHPHRGERNEPAYTRLVVQKIAEILQKSEEEIENITTANAKTLFKAFAKSF
ncbi:MAG: TatD family hydrolase [Sulfurospirillum sp.]|nr:TatD family hydrolase [Sulfurospirillum sp.]